MTLSLFAVETNAFRNARQMSCSTFDDSALLFRTRSAVTKLLERLNLEKPSINVVSKPLEPVTASKTRLKFPDPKKDCRVHLNVSSCNGKLSLPICYENQEEDDVCLYSGLMYILQVVSVKRFSLDGKQLLSDKPPDNFYCCFPLSAHKRGPSKKTLGFWFRFFGPEAMFRITVALKLDVEYVANFVGTSYLSDPIFKNNGIISREEIEILSRPKASRNSAVLEKDGIINTAKIAPSLYSNKEYKSMVVTLKDLKQKLNFKGLEKFCVQTLEKLDDSDLKCVLLLEQSQEACRKKHYERSKQLLKKAVDHASKCKNKTLLMGRAYVYLSHVHQKDGYLGNADECLAIARKKLLAMESCEDIGDLCFQEGLILMNFAQKMPKFAVKLITEAMRKFEQAVVQFKSGLRVDNVLDKLCCSYIRLASLILQQKPPVFNKEDSFVKQNITLANNHLDWVKDRLADLTDRTKFHFYICCTELLYEKRHFEKAKQSLEHAFQIAKTCQFEEQIIWKGMPGKSLNEGALNDELSDREQADDGEVEDFVNDDEIPLGYHADVSS